MGCLEFPYPNGILIVREHIHGQKVQQQGKLFTGNSYHPEFQLDSGVSVKTFTPRMIETNGLDTVICRFC